MAITVSLEPKTVKATQISTKLMKSKLVLMLKSLHCIHDVIHSSRFLS